MQIHARNGTFGPSSDEIFVEIKKREMLLKLLKCECILVCLESWEGCVVSSVNVLCPVIECSVALLSIGRLWEAVLCNAMQSTLQLN